jgi:hypothetical protein
MKPEKSNQQDISRHYTDTKPCKMMILKHGCSLLMKYKKVIEELIYEYARDMNEFENIINMNIMVSNFCIEMAQIKIYFTKLSALKFKDIQENEHLKIKE